MKRILIALFLCLGLAGLTTHAADAKPDSDVAVITFKDYGQIVLELWPDVAPGHVENFKKLAKSGFYDGTASHRVIPGFMIQLGDPNTKDPSKAATFGQGGPGYTIKDEPVIGEYARGVLAMARSAAPDSQGSQFFIVLDDGAQPPLESARTYAILGRVTAGMDVVDEIANVERDAEDRPVVPVTIVSTTVSTPAP